MTDAIGRLQSLRREGGSFSLGPRTRLRLSGADRLRYLNGQASNDLRKLKPGEAMRALVLTAKGKLCADIFVWHEGESLIVDAGAALGENLLTRLERYAISDDVSFELLDASATGWHVFGTAADSVDGLKISRIGENGKDVPAAPAALQATPEEVATLCIERGIPRWGYELTEEILPQEAQLENEAVDFAKGCYVGQEVVSRLRSVGHVNRNLAGFIGEFTAEPGLLSLRTSSGDSVGRLTSTVDHPELGRKIALGYLSTKCATDQFSVFNESGACLGTVERSQFPLVS